MNQPWLACRNFQCVQVMSEFHSFFKNFLRTSHGWYVEISNACESCLSSVHFLKLSSDQLWLAHGNFQYVQVMSEFRSFFKLHMAHSHEWHMDLLNVCHSWLCAAQFFFNLKEHSTLMNGKCKVKICAIHQCVMFSLKNSGIYTTRNTQAFIQRNTQAFIQRKTQAFIPKKKLWHLYKKTLRHLYKKTLRHLYKTH